MSIAMDQHNCFGLLDGEDRPELMERLILKAVSATQNIGKKIHEGRQQKPVEKQLVGPSLQAKPLVLPRHVLDDGEWITVTRARGSKRANTLEKYDELDSVKVEDPEELEKLTMSLKQALKIEEPVTNETTYDDDLRPNDESEEFCNVGTKQKPKKRKSKRGNKCRNNNELEKPPRKTGTTLIWAILMIVLFFLGSVFLFG